jgi:hypothetical protein
MVEKIANALEIEPFRLFIDDNNRNKENQLLAQDYLECLTAVERQDLTKRLIDLISSDIGQVLQPENR